MFGVQSSAINSLGKRKLFALAFPCCVTRVLSVFVYLLFLLVFLIGYDILFEMFRDIFTNLKSTTVENGIRPRGYKTFFMLNSAEHEICPANKSQITDNCKFFLAKHN